MAAAAKALALILAFAGAASVSAQTCDAVGSSRIDCGYLGIDQGQCEGKGCCWRPSTDGSPWCFNKVKTCGGYALANIQTSASAIEADLLLRGTGCALYGADLPKLRLSVRYETDERLRVRIGDVSSSRYEVPQKVLRRTTVDSPVKGSRDTAALRLEYTSEPFGFAVIRTADNEVLFDTRGRQLVFEDQYIEFSSVLPKDANVYGLGEVVHDLRLDPYNTRRTLWTRDAATPVDQNVYGAHPFYLEYRNGKAHGVFLLNSNGMDVFLTPGAVTYKVIGGIIDLYFFPGSNPNSVVKQYTELIGRPTMMPYWSLGWHQCRYGYNTLKEVQEVVRKYKENSIPLETMWADIDYMDQYKVFTYDFVRYPLSEMQSFIKTLHGNDQKIVLILDPGIKVEAGFETYESGLELGIYILNNKTGKPFRGSVWPGDTTFPDWFNPKTQSWWTKEIAGWFEKTPLDGIWIDMNEIANFCNGDCLNPATNRVAGRDVNFPPYKINNAGDGAPLNYKTTDMDAVHYGGLQEYDVHNVFGHMEAIATYNSLVTVNANKRPFILSRSTFPGSGQYTAHWTGDNFSSWAHLFFSVTGVLAFQMFGIPMVGADICGFIDDTTEELCARWTAVGAFFPFSRNHNTIGAKSQEPYVWASVASVARKALNMRYSLLPLYYTLFHSASTTGSMVLRPLFFEWPADTKLAQYDRQFMIGSSVLVSPVLTQGATSLGVYFPEGEWYDLWTRSYVATSPKEGKTLVFSAPWDFIALHLRGGNIVVQQKPAMTITATRKNDFFVVVGLDAQGKAAGELYLDDGESIEVGSAFSTISYTASPVASNSGARLMAQDDESSFVAPDAVAGGRLVASGTFGYSTAGVLSEIYVLGVTSTPTRVTINGVRVATSNFSYDPVRRELELVKLTLPMNKEFVVEWN